ncbi:conjugal transfer protein TrbL [Promicromonospora sp. NPDC023987]|uniref:conjugal transfer protein TrbL n=1 Tax=Promicromonospora sp. NPDC023987 TaxID=3155360 RepID=UPI0033D95DFE
MGLCSNPVTAGVCQQAAEEATTQAGVVVGDLINTFAEGIGELASFLLVQLWNLMATTTLVDVTRGEFTTVYNLVFGIAVFLMLGFFLLQLTTGMLRREPGALARAVFGLAKSVLGSFVVITLTATLLEITDQVCLGIVRASGTTMEAMGAQFATVGAVATTGSVLAPLPGALLSLFLAGLTVAAVVIVWFSLLIRKALLLVAIALAPLALAGASWDATRGWVGKWAQFVVALIVSKLVLVVVFLLAVSFTGTPVAADLATWSEKLAGIVLLLVASFAPYMTYKAISFMGFDMYHAMSVEQEAKSALNRPMPVTAGGAAAGGFMGRKPQNVLGADGRPTGNGGGQGGGPGATGAGTGGPGIGGSSGGGSAAGAAAPKVISAGAGSSSGAAAGAGAAGAGAAAAGVAAPVVIGAQLAKAAATAGPKAGAAVAGAAGQQTDAASPGATGSAAGAARARPQADAGSASAPVRDVPTVLGKEQR